MRKDEYVESERAMSRLSTAFTGAALVGSVWLLFYVMLVLVDMREPYRQRLANAWAVEDHMNGSHWASIVRPLLMH